MVRAADGSLPLPKGLACQRCKVRKTRCSGERPACKACIRSARFKHLPTDHIVCVYSESPSYDPTMLSFTSTSASSSASGSGSSLGSGSGQMTALALDLHQRSSTESPPVAPSSPIPRYSAFDPIITTRSNSNVLPDAADASTRDPSSSWLSGFAGDGSHRARTLPNNSASRSQLASTTSHSGNPYHLPTASTSGILPHQRPGTGPPPNYPPPRPQPSPYASCEPIGLQRLVAPQQPIHGTYVASGGQYYVGGNAALSSSSLSNFASHAPPVASSTDGYSIGLHVPSTTTAYMESAPGPSAQSYSFTERRKNAPNLISLPTGSSRLPSSALAASVGARTSSLHPEPLAPSIGGSGGSASRGGGSLLATGLPTYAPSEEALAEMLDQHAEAARTTAAMQGQPSYVLSPWPVWGKSPNAPDYRPK